MYKNKRILAIIPARGGSKGIPRKNIKNLQGKPLISYSIEAGIKSQYLDSVVVSTDDDEIASISKEYGAKVPCLRPSELATDTSKTIDAILHMVKFLEEGGDLYDVLVLLQPTQPLRTVDDIDKAIETYFANEERPLVSISEVDDHPILIRSIKEGILCPLLNISSTCRRQDMPAYYRVNGCIYINPINELNSDTSFNDNCIPFIMEHSHAVDIDELRDFVLAEYYLKSK